MPAIQQEAHGWKAVLLPKPLDIVALMNLLVELASPKDKRARAKPRIEVIRGGKKSEAG